MLNDIDIGFCRADIYPDIRVEDVVKLVLKADFQRKIEISEGFIPLMKLSKLSNCTYFIEFSSFGIESFKHPYKEEDIKIMKIPYSTNQYFCQYLDNTYAREMISCNYKEKQYKFSSIIKLEAECFDKISWLYWHYYLEDIGEPKIDSITHYLLKNFFGDWKILSIKEEDSKKSLKSTEDGVDGFILNLQKMVFDDSYDNVIYKSLGSSIL